jgi:hypothetical protein
LANWLKIVQLMSCEFPPQFIRRSCSALGIPACQ